jgi:hypothetical protein
MKRPNKADLAKYHVDHNQDTGFASHARLLQSKWRENNGYPFSEWGNRLEGDFAKKTKANFLTDYIKELATQEIESAKANHALMKEDRMWANLLSSQPLCFNLFGELKHDLSIATKYFQNIFPALNIEKVSAIKFEHSPGRQDVKYLGDRTAFDVFIEYVSADNKPCFIGIEVKYSENPKKDESKQVAEKVFQKNETRYMEVYNDHPNLFKPNSIGGLRYPPCSQIWRDHMLSLVTKQDYHDGIYVFLYPEQNDECCESVNKYIDCLQTDDETKSGFYIRTLEVFIDNLKGLVPNEFLAELKARYIGV